MMVTRRRTYQTGFCAKVNSEAQGSQLIPFPSWLTPLEACSIFTRFLSFFYFIKQTRRLFNYHLFVFFLTYTNLYLSFWHRQRWIVSFAQNVFFLQHRYLYIQFNNSQDLTMILTISKHNVKFMPFYVL